MDKIKVKVQLGKLFEASQGNESLSQKKQKPVVRYALSSFKQLVESERKIIVDSGLATDQKVIEIQNQMNEINFKDIPMVEKLAEARKLREDNKEILDADVEKQKKLDEVLKEEKEFEFVKLDKSLVDLEAEYTEFEWKCILFLTNCTEEEIFA